MATNWLSPRNGCGSVRRQSKRRSRDVKRCNFERLEDRALLAAERLFNPLPEFQNPIRQFDVNNDTRVTALDALIVINQLNSTGPRALPLAPNAIAASSAVGRGAPAGPFGLVKHYVDTNGDGMLTARDALGVINKLNEAAPDMVRMRLEITDLAGNPVVALSPGEQFQLRGYAQDVREPSDDPQRGVFSVFYDVVYDPAVVEVDLVGRSIQYSQTYSNQNRPQQSIVAQQGLLDDIGGIAGTTTPLGPTEQLVFIAPFRAVGAGNASFSGNPEDSPFHEVLVFGTNDPVPEAEQDFVGDTAPIGVTPSASIGDVAVDEGDAGTTSATFTVTLSSAAVVPVTISYTTADDTGAPNPATAGNDYTTTAGQVTFDPGQTTKTITVDVLGDLADEPNETFRVVLSNPTGATIGDDTAIGTIRNDDATPVISINDQTIAEPASGTTTMTFTVSLERPARGPVSVAFTTVNGSAIAGQDYQAASGTVSFAAGESSKPITITVLADGLNEGGENFQVVLSNPMGGVLGDSSGTGRILDQAGIKAALTFEVVDLQGQPKPSAEVGEQFRVRAFVEDIRDNPQGVFQFFHDLKFNPALVSADPGSVMFGPDYTDQRTFSISTNEIDEIGASSGSIDPLGPGRFLLWEAVFTAQAEGFAQFTADPADALPVHEVGLYGEDEPVDPSLIAYGSFSVPIGTAPRFSINDVTIAEGNAGTTQATFTVSLSIPVDGTVTVDFATAAGTATEGVDYVGRTGTLTFAPQELQKTITIDIVGDTIPESDENFFVNLTNAVGANIADAQGEGRITDDEPFTLSIGDATLGEGFPGTFVVSLSRARSEVVTVQFVSADGTATAGVDYLPASGVLTFAPGQTTQTITVLSLADTIDDSGETFFINLSNPVGAELGDAQGVGTISETPPEGIGGFVYVDTDGDGVKDPNEMGLAGVFVELIGTNEFGAQIQELVVTDATGAYRFTNLASGTYSIHQFQPGFYRDGVETPGSAAGFITANDWFFVNFQAGQAASNFNFGEAGLRPQFISKRMFMASTQPMGQLPTLNLSGGDAWFSFDGGFNSLDVQAVSNTGQPVWLALYDYNLNLLAMTTASALSQLSYTGNPLQTYFLRVGGGSSSVSMNMFALGGLQATSASPFDDIFATTENFTN